jgi:hypothetical protein
MDAGPPTRCGTGADERAAWPNKGGGARFHSVGHSTWLRRPLAIALTSPPIASIAPDAAREVSVERFRTRSFDQTRQLSF